MPTLVAIVIIFIIGSLLDSYPWLWLVLAGLAAAYVVLWLLVERGESWLEKMRERAAYRKQVADEIKRAAYIEAGLRTTYERAEAAIRKATRKSL
ncbi:hypothetical protein [Pedococcus soli]